MVSDLALKCVGVVGAGAMGAGIAQVTSMAGIPVKLYDTRPEAAATAIAKIRSWFDKRVSEGKMSSSDRDAFVANLSVANDLGDMAACDMIVEAIIESAQAKIDLFNALEAVIGDETILASNTSSIPIGVLAAGCRRQGRIAGLHFFNPVPLMKLVEIIAAPKTTSGVLDSLSRYVQAIGKVAVNVKDMPGFLVNFGGRAFPTEGLAIVHEGVATPAQVDAIMRDCYGFRMGPFELMDLTGIDVNFPVTELIHQSFFNDPRLRSTPLHRYMLATRQLGRKTGRGFYDYAEDAQRDSGDTQAAASFSICSEVVAPGASEQLAALLSEAGISLLSQDDGTAPWLVSLVGDDCATYASRTGVDHTRLVAIDLMGDTSKRLTLMAAPGHDDALVQSLVGTLAKIRKVTLIHDSMGFVGQRIVGMVANLGCDMAQTQLASTTDIDLAMRLGLNYPQGPLEMVDTYGARQVYQLMTTLQSISGDDRYRPSPWLRRCAQLGFSARHSQ